MEFTRDAFDQLPTHVQQVIEAIFLCYDYGIESSGTYEAEVQFAVEEYYGRGRKVLAEPDRPR